MKKLRSGDYWAAEAEEGCRTPRHDGCRLPPEAKVCPPPPPRKKPYYGRRRAEKRKPPAGGYFQPPDLELFFALITPRRKAALL
ncbi:unnamed protein product [Cuscuta campestris]|uniref:Uncharacterized protein n=1 Tax=Cuscuta campestris TaxID=132261 RepID=A0A484LWP1_9ASTE|nr:unnamed protein product [Cuscuta campestris]